MHERTHARERECTPLRNRIHTHPHNSQEQIQQHPQRKCEMTDVGGRQRYRPRASSEFGQDKVRVDNILRQYLTLAVALGNLDCVRLLHVTCALMSFQIRARVSIGNPSEICRKKHMYKPYKY